MSYRYIGNKTKLLPVLMSEIKKIVNDGDTVVDLMCGTSSVSEALRIEGYRVISTDLMTFSSYHAMVRLLANRTPSFKKLEIGSYRDVLEYLNRLNGVSGYFYKEFSPEGSPQNTEKVRQYFTAENAKKIDTINTQLNKWKKQNKLSKMENAFLRHSFVLAVNRVANIAGTYGHYRSSWNKAALNSISLREAEFVRGHSTDHIVMQGAAEELSSKITADLCYIDPPYMKRQYAANYHVIETVARGDAPEAIGVSGLRPWRDQYSNFCSKVKIRESFSKIFTEMNCSKFLISYSEDGLLSKKELLNLFSQFGRAECKEINYRRFKSNKSSLNKMFNEYLFYVEKS